MPQIQRLVPLLLHRREPRQAVATGNNAAWHCDCSRELPLVGCTGSLEGPSIHTRVSCPDCGKNYFVVPEGKDRGAVLEVREI